MLIAVGAVLASEQTRLIDAMARLKKVEVAAADRALVETIKRNPRLTELLAQATGSASQREIDEFWRKLVEGNDVIEDMERHGVSRIALKEGSQNLAKLQRLLSRGVDPDKAARGAALAVAIDEVVAAKSLPMLTPQQAITLIERGIAASGQLREHDGGRHDWPPIINLSEAGGYYFATGSADPTPDFELALRTVVVDRLLQIARSFDVDVIEVIGHTDEQPINNRVSNLDRSLPSVASGAGNAGSLQWADNAGLGLARALAVVRTLSSDSRLRSFRILPFSGAQLIDTDGRITRWDGQSDVRERRRIEIRMRKAT
jgi:hypothetical protein